jgi:indolepyruvate ferredoxin oxidoreductase beta subunit
MSSVKPGIDRPLTIVIAAMGGEGGGLLADWIVEGAKHSGILIQSTSIPGVAQRTGATAYYLEMMRAPEGHAIDPVFGLYPAPGYIDIAVASELIEAGRLLEKGLVSPDRTTLIASTHRIYAMAERTALGDGSFDTQGIMTAARELSHRLVMSDLVDLARGRNTALNAIMLGAIAGTGLLPFQNNALETAITTRGISVASNLKGFRAGLELANTPSVSDNAVDLSNASPLTEHVAHPLITRARQRLPATALDVIESGIARLIDYQDTEYAALYLDRVERIAAIDRETKPSGNTTLTREAARHLALWMSYEDVMRVADLKSRHKRIARVRQESGATFDEPVRITEFLNPGIEEFATLLPTGVGRRLMQWADNRGITHRLHLPMHLRSDTIWGMIRLRFLAWLSIRRRNSYRFILEQAMIERWLDAATHAAKMDLNFAFEVICCARLIKGYSDTRERANRHFDHLLERIVTPALAGLLAPVTATAWLKDGCAAALADDEGKGLEAILDQGPPTSTFTASQSPTAATPPVTA